MASSSKVVTATVVVDDDARFGFKRPDMYSETESLCGSVFPYNRHVFLCYEGWTARVESFESDLLYKRLIGAIKERCNVSGVQTLLTICDGGDGTGLSEGDVLIIPDMIKYRGLEESNIDTFVEEVLVNGKPWALGTQEVVTGSYVFVCSHSSTPDKRCGVCGPVLIKRFNQEIELRALKDQVFVSAYSCTGSHMYAGHLIIYGEVRTGELSGHWYGYVVPNDVAELIDQHIRKGEPIERIWRGQLGVHRHLIPKTAVEQTKTPVEQTTAAVEQTTTAVEQMHPQGNVLEASREAGNISNTEGNISNTEGTSGGRFRFKAKKSRYNAAAIVGAVATVAMAYSFYKRSR